MTHLVIDGSGSGGTFTIATGDLFEVSLEENPTTGYQWHPEPREENILTPQGDDYTAVSNAAFGGGGTRSFTFRADSTGSARIAFVLRREWEAPDEAIGHFRATINVEDK